MSELKPLRVREGHADLSIPLRKVRKKVPRGSSIISNALLTWWHQALDLRQEVTADNSNAILVTARRHRLPSRDRHRSCKCKAPIYTDALA
jgi:hypothetical protein